MADHEEIPGTDPSLDAHMDEVREHRFHTIAFERSLTPMIIAEAGSAENPIILANQAFLDLTGYALSEVIGKDCRFLQGKNTSKVTTATIADALRAEINVDLTILNYRKDGSEFWNELHISPIRDDKGDVIYYFASQIDATETHRIAGLEASERRLRMEVDHRTKNVLAVVNSIVRLSRSDDPKRYAASIRQRVQALADVHTLLAEGGWHPVLLGKLIRQQFKDVSPNAVHLDGPTISVDATDAQPIALIFHELAVNALVHGALASEAGKTDVCWSRVGMGDFEISWSETGGAPPAAARTPGFGTVMVDMLVEKQLRGTIERDWLDAGLVTTIRLPAREL